MSAKEKKSSVHEAVKVDEAQRQHLENQMSALARRNPSWKVAPTAFSDLYPRLVVQKLFFLYDDEVEELLIPVDRHVTGMVEELLDYFMIIDTGDEIQLKLFQFKFNAEYSKGISTKELYAFVERMNKVFLHGDLQDQSTLEGFKVVRDAFDKACAGRKKAAKRVQCYFVTNGQNVSSSDQEKVEQIRTAFQGDRQAYGFTFETYGGLDIYNLAVHGRVPIQDEVIQLECPDERTYLDWNIGSNPTGMPVRVVQGFVNVNQLVRLVDRYSNNELFEKNVRLFLGTKKGVNQKIIETITGNQSNWFGFMNNGVSITADDVRVNPPPSGKKLSVVMKNMQIINGCQTVNALYHAKYDPELKDRFQSNSNVMVRIYHIDPSNTHFLEALIIATNSQNAIRAEDLLSTDPPQIELEEVLKSFGVGYVRKQGTASMKSRWLEITKESSAMAFMSVFWERYTSRLRNSASRREVFNRGDEYKWIFSWGEDQPDDTPLLAENSQERALQILLALLIENYVREEITRGDDDKTRRAILKKAAYFLSRGVFLKNQSSFVDLLNESKVKEPSVEVAQEIAKKVLARVKADLPAVVTAFDEALKEHTANTLSEHDSALKNTKFASLFEQEISKDAPKKQQ